MALLAWSLVGLATPGRALAVDLDVTTLTGDVVHHLEGAALVGPVAGSTMLTVGVVLHNPNESAEDAYLARVYDPTSDAYQQFLDPSLFNAEFGVPAATQTAAQQWVSNGGLRVQPIDGATNFFLATGTAARVERLFGTPLNNYTAGGRSFYANALPPTVPAKLGVMTVTGLNNYGFFVTPHDDRTAASERTTVESPIGAAVPETGLLSPKALWSIYDLPATNLGNAQTMAIFGWGASDGVENALRSFETENELPQVPLTFNSYGDTNTPATADATSEWQLDTQASTAMAPNVVSEKLYFARHNTETDLLASWVGWVNDRQGPLQASASYGECETIPATAPVVGVDSIEVPGDELFKQAAIEGRTVFAVTGDWGSSCPVVVVPPNGIATAVYPGLLYPAASPYAVAVGGTDLNSDGGNPPKRFSETAWEFGGGGNSTNEPAGDYQNGVAPLHCLTDQSGNPYTSGAAPLCRGIPDVAALSGDVFTGNGIAYTNDDGNDQQGGGTSLSSPLWMGMWTRIQAAAKSKGLGFANQSIYRVAKSARYRDDFFDVTVGDNQPYPATPGWDNTTGWGAPDVAHLMWDLTGRLTPVNNVPAGAIAPIPQVKGCGTVFTDPAGDDTYVFEGEVLAAQGTNPQLDIVDGVLCLSTDGKTLRTTLHIRNLTTQIPTGGLENDYIVRWTFNGVSYFTQLAIEPDGTVLAYDGQAITTPAVTRFQQLHVDTGSITPGPDGTVEVAVPLVNIGNPTSAQVLQTPTGDADVREGAFAGLLATVDSAEPNADFVIP